MLRARTMQTARTSEQRLEIPPAVLRGHTRRVWLWALLVLVAGGAFAARTLLKTEAPVARYRTWNLERRTVTSVVEAAGQLDVPNRAEVPAPAGAPLVEIAVEVGAVVEAGQVLARLDARSASAALASAKATLDGATAQVAESAAALRSASDARRRAEGLAAKGLASDGDLVAVRAAEDRARAALAGARADRAKAAAAVATGDADVGLRTIRAPIAGIVLSAPRWQGVVASPEKGPLFVIGSPVDVLRLEVAVSEADISTIKPKQSALFTMPAFPGRELEAEVEAIRIEAVRRDGAVTFPVLLRAANPDRTLLPGMTATARIKVAEAKDVLVVREAALRFAPEGAPPAPPRSRVWRSRDGVELEPVPVVAGVSDGAFTEVRPAEGAELAPNAPIVIGLLPVDEGSGPGISLGGKK